MINIKVYLRKGKVKNVELPDHCRVSFYEYHAPEDYMIDKDPEGKKCRQVIWSTQKTIKYLVNVYMKKGKVFKVDSPKDVDVEFFEET